MLTDMTPSAGQFYGSQIPAMGMNITNISSHMQKPTGGGVSTLERNTKITMIFYLSFISKWLVFYWDFYIDDLIYEIETLEYLGRTL